MVKFIHTGLRLKISEDKCIKVSQIIHKYLKFAIENPFSIYFPISMVTSKFVLKYVKSLFLRVSPYSKSKLE